MDRQASTSRTLAWQRHLRTTLISSLYEGHLQQQVLLPTCPRIFTSIKGTTASASPLFGILLTASVRNSQLRVDHCSPRTYLGHSMAGVRCISICKASANIEQKVRARHRSLPPHPVQGTNRWRYHHCPIKPTSLQQPESSLHR